MDEINFKYRRNLDAITRITGYLKGLRYEYSLDWRDYLKIGAKKEICETLLEMLKVDVNSDPMDILQMMKADMEYESVYAFERNMIRSGIIFKASSEACKDLIHSML